MHFIKNKLMLIKFLHKQKKGDVVVYRQPVFIKIVLNTIRVVSTTF